MKKLLLLLAALLPGSVLAADLDIASSYRSGDWNVVEVLLCDEAPSVECPELDLHLGRPGDNSWPGLPRYVVVDIRLDNCTTDTVGDFVGVSTAGGQEHILVAGMDLTGGPTSGTVDPLTHRFVRFDITTPGSGGTCDDFEVVLRMFYERVSGG